LPGVIVPKTATVGERVFILPRGVGRVAHETSRLSPRKEWTVSDELKAAIDRQRRYMGGENGYRVYFPEFVGRNHNWTDAEESEYVRRKRRDKEILALAYLAEHPADDDEPITADWLRSVGAKEVDLSWRNDQFSTHLPAYVFGNGRFGVWGHEAAWSMYLLNADGFDGQEEHVTAVRTRGQLRRLCAALGITLTQEQQ
jgi:hypothetical protein